jgi:inner membrane protein
MPTIMTHALLPLIGAAALPRVQISRRLVFAGMMAAMLPDADVAGRLFAIPHSHDLGHRGVTHTWLFALLVAGLGLIAARPLRSRPLPAFLFLLASTLSHSVTDMLTTGGKGIMLLWPFDHQRFKFAFHPVEVSPVGMRALESGRIWSVLASEALWLIAPCILLAFFCRLAVKYRRGSPLLIDSGRKAT